MSTAAAAPRGKARLRAIDRYLGIPLVAVGGAVKRPRPLPDRIRRIGIVNSTNIGDTVLLAPVAQDVAATFADAETIVFAGAATAPLVRLLDGIRAIPLRLSSPLDAVRTLRRERLDVVLDFDQWPRVEPIYCMLSGARWAGGFRAPRQHRHYWYDGVVDHSDRVHELDNYRRLVELIGVDSRSIPSIRPPREVPAGDLPRDPYVVFHLWPTGLNSVLKEWPLDRWRALARDLGGRGLTVVLTGGPADVERTREFIASAGDVEPALVDVSGKYDLAQVVDVLCGSRCVVSVNTGVMHLAAATGAPTVGLNGPTSERRWGPVGRHAVSVNSAFEGCGYLHFGWEYRGRREDCMNGITVERVRETVLELIDDR